MGMPFKLTEDLESFMKTTTVFLIVLSGLISACDRVPSCADMQSSIIDDLAESTSGNNNKHIKFGSIEQKSVSEENKRRSCTTTVLIDELKNHDGFELEYDIYFDEKNSSYGMKYVKSQLDDIKQAFVPLDKAIEFSKQFTISANGEEMTDKTTGLVWKRCDEGQVYDSKQNICTGDSKEYTFVAAQQHAQEVAASTGKAWRVPTVDEWKSLFDRIDKTSLRYYSHIMPFDGKFWSSSPYVGNAYYAWVVDFIIGNVYYVSYRIVTYAVRLVRGG